MFGELCYVRFFYVGRGCVVCECLVCFWLGWVFFVMLEFGMWVCSFLVVLVMRDMWGLSRVGCVFCVGGEWSG